MHKALNQLSDEDLARAVADRAAAKAKAKANPKAEPKAVAAPS